MFFLLLPTIIIPFILLYYKILKFIILWRRRGEKIEREKEKKEEGEMMIN